MIPFLLRYKFQAAEKFTEFQIQSAPSWMSIINRVDFFQLNLSISIRRKFVRSSGLETDSAVIPSMELFH